MPQLGRIKQISRWVNGNPFMLSAGSSALGVAVSDFVGAVYEYLNLALLLDGTGIYFGTRDLARAGPSLARVVAAAGEVDAAIGIASYRAGRDDWSRPELRTGGATELTDLRHPLIDDAVPNSIVLKPGHGVLVTGSNMSGKSTFLRTVGVNAILAQTINTCLAQAYRAPVFHVRSCIGRTDDLLSGTSYYLAEVEALLELVRASTSPAPHLFLLDELFRGTNAVERIAAGQAVLHAAARRGRAGPAASRPRRDPRPRAGRADLGSVRGVPFRRCHRSRRPDLQPPPAARSLHQPQRDRAAASARRPGRAGPSRHVNRRDARSPAEDGASVERPPSPRGYGHFRGDGVL